MSGNLHAAMALHRKGRLREAGRIYQKILQAQPNEVNSLHLLGAIRLAEGDAEAARTLIGRPLELKPDYAEAHLNMGSVYRALGRPREALASYDTALSMRADLLDAHYNRGVVLHEIGELDAALSSYRIACSLRTDHAEALSNAALIFLLRGDLAAGWPLYEWRLATPQFRAAHPQPLPGARWSGSESLAGQRILVFCEQGLGDALQFARYLPLLAERAPQAQIVVSARPALHRIFSRLPGVSAVIDSFKGERFDFHCALLSLPGIFGTTLKDIPSAKTPYLSVDPQWVASWRNSLDEALAGERRPRAGRRRIGLMWSGGQVTPIKGRSIPLAMLGELLALPVDFISLQKELAPDDAALLQTLPQLHHFGAPFPGVPQTDFADTAGIISELDWVISVDTSVAHLAAALGKETWIPLPKVSDWRWLEDRSDSPWYPQVRLLRQSTAGDWAPILREIRAAIEARL